MKKTLIFLLLFAVNSCKKKNTPDSKLPESLEVKISNLTPLPQVVQISDVHNTNDISILRFTLKTSNTDLNIKKNLSITLVASTNLVNVVTGIRLKVDGQTLEVVSPHISTSPGVIRFDNFDFHIKNNDSVLVSISVDVKPIGTFGFPDGTAIKSEVTTNQVKGITAFYKNGIAFPGPYKGSASGEVITFRR